MSSSWVVNHLRREQCPSPQKYQIQWKTSVMLIFFQKIDYLYYINLIYKMPLLFTTLGKRFSLSRLRWRQRSCLQKRWNKMQYICHVIFFNRIGLWLNLIYKIPPIFNALGKFFSLGRLRWGQLPCLQKSGIKWVTHVMIFFFKKSSSFMGYLLLWSDPCITLK